MDGTTGYLITHYSNQLKAYRQKGAFPQSRKKNIVKEIVPENNEPDEANLSDINWLRSNTENWTIYESKWAKLAELRCADYFKMEFAALTIKWPMLSNVNFAPELVSNLLFNLGAIYKSMKVICQSTTFCFYYSKSVRLEFCYLIQYVPMYRHDNIIGKTGQGN